MSQQRKENAETVPGERDQKKKLDHPPTISCAVKVGNPGRAALDEKALSTAPLFAGARFQPGRGIRNPLDRVGRQIADRDVRFVVAEERA